MPHASPCGPRRRPTLSRAVLTAGACRGGEQHGAVRRAKGAIHQGPAVAATVVRTGTSHGPGRAAVPARGTALPYTGPEPSARGTDQLLATTAGWWPQTQTFSDPPIIGPGRPTREPVCEMAPKKSATVIEQELRELRAWVLAHQGALAARGSDRPGLRGRLRQHWSEDEQHWYRWLQWHGSRFEGD